MQYQPIIVIFYLFCLLENSYRSQVQRYFSLFTMLFSLICFFSFLMRILHPCCKFLLITCFFISITQCLIIKIAVSLKSFVLQFALFLIERRKKNSFAIYLYFYLPKTRTKSQIPFGQNKFRRFFSSSRPLALYCTQHLSLIVFAYTVLQSIFQPCSMLCTCFLSFFHLLKILDSIPSTTQHWFSFLFCIFPPAKIMNQIQIDFNRPLTAALTINRD